MRRDLYVINGVSEINYDGEMSVVQAVQNTSEARIYGFEAGLKMRLSKALELNSQFTLTKGRQQHLQNEAVAVRHVAPAFGNVHMIWKHKKITIDGFLNYSGSLTFKDISQELSSHLFALDANGNSYAPSWVTVNLRTKYQLTNSLSFVGSIENISNQGYRPFASGISGPGTNLIFAIRYQK